MHHSRRKSGHGSMTDVRKAASTSDSKHKSSSKQSSSSSRRTGGSSSQPSSKSSKSGSSSRDAEKARDDDYWYDDERESFPQFWYVTKKKKLCLCPFAFPPSFLGSCNLGFPFGRLASSPDAQTGDWCGARTFSLQLNCLFKRSIALYQSPLFRLNRMAR